MPCHSFVSQSRVQLVPLLSRVSRYLRFKTCIFCCSVSLKIVPVQDGVRDPVEPRREVEYEQDIWLRVPFEVNQDNVKCRLLGILARGKTLCLFCRGSNPGRPVCSQTLHCKHSPKDTAIPLLARGCMQRAATSVR
jgi:hypothetical protein